jgi:hypothetical protein
MVLDTAKAGLTKPLQLSSIPVGSDMTVFLGRPPLENQDNAAKNVVLAVRFDRVPSVSLLPVGVVLPCFSPAR